MNKEPIHCEHCGGEIKNYSDLVIISEFLSLYPHTYHEKCYAKNLKKIRGTFFGKPLNTFKNTVSVIILSFLSIILFILELKEGSVKASWLLIIVSVIEIYFRFYSWIAYERKYN